MSAYTTKGLAEKIGVTHRQLLFWVTRQYLTPTPINGNFDRKPGSGNYHVWTGREVDIATWFALLVRAGIEPRSASDIARKLADGRSHYLPGGIEVRRAPMSGGAR